MTCNISTIKRTHIFLHIEKKRYRGNQTCSNLVLHLNRHKIHGLSTIFFIFIIYLIGVMHSFYKRNTCKLHVFRLASWPAICGSNPQMSLKPAKPACGPSHPHAGPACALWAKSGWKWPNIKEVTAILKMVKMCVFFVKFLKS